MAIETRFKCSEQSENFLIVRYHVEKKHVHIKGVNDNVPFNYTLDETTAIKFAKTIRTAINKIK